VLTSVAEMAYPTVYKEGTHEVPMRRPFTFGAVPLHGIWGGRIVVADNGSWRIDSHGPDGALVRSTRFALPLRPVTQAMRDSVFAREERQIPENVAVPQAILDQFLEMSRGQQFADSVAPYDRIFVARDGDLWIRQNEMPVDTATTWMRIGRNGQLAARLQLPRGWALLDADQARVLIRRTDDLDLGYLEILPIRMGDQ
jgi:hypothetical protein